MATRKKKAQEEKPDGEKLLEDIKAGDHVLCRMGSSSPWRDAKVTKAGRDYIHVEMWPNGRTNKYDRFSGCGEYGSRIATPAFLALEERLHESAELLRQHGFSVEGWALNSNTFAVFAMTELLLSLIAEGKVKDRRPKPPSAPDLPEDA